MAKIGLDLRLWQSGTGGISRYSRNLLRELLSIDSENQYVAILTPEAEKEFKEKAPNLTKLVVDIPHYSLAEQRWLTDALNKENFDLVHFMQFNHPLLYRRPFVVTIHDMIMHMFPGSNQRRSLLRRWGYKTVFNDCMRANRIIVPSQSTKDDLIKKLHFPLEKINVTPEGSDPTFRVHSQAEKQKIIQKYALPKRFLLYVSRWEAYKGLPTTLAAFEKLSAKYPDLGLVITGKPDRHSPEVAELVNAAQRRNKHIITPGFVPDEDLAPLYAAASVYVHPSQYEGFGIMILEAFASGVPVVTSNVSSLPEVSGEAALLVDPKNTNEIVEVIERLLTDKKLAETMIERGLERVKEFSWAKMAKQTLEIYRQILAKK